MYSLAMDAIHDHWLLSLQFECFNEKSFEKLFYRTMDANLIGGDHMADLIDRIFFQDLVEQNPQDVCRRASCRFDVENQCYLLVVWGYPYQIFPYQCKIKCLDKHIQRPHEWLSLFMLHYLLKAKEIEISNEWISEKDIPGGTTFFRGPHAIPTHLISHRFKNDMKAFKKRCEQLHGIALNLADQAYRFEITPKIPVAVLYWYGDDDFPTESKILFDRTIIEQLPADIIYALAVGICDILAKPLA